MRAPHLRGSARVNARVAARRVTSSDATARMLTNPTCLISISGINICSLSVSLMNLVPLPMVLSLGPIYFRNFLRSPETTLGLRNLQSLVVISNVCTSRAAARDAAAAGLFSRARATASSMEAGLFRRARATASSRDGLRDSYSHKLAA